jgi:hypothetical protein
MITDDQKMRHASDEAIQGLSCLEEVLDNYCGVNV